MAEEIDFSNLAGSEKNLDFRCKVLEVETKEITQHDKKHNILVGLLGNRTGTIPFTIWEPDRIKVEKNDVLEVKNARATKRYGRVEIYFVAGTAISKLPPDAAAVGTIPTKSTEVQVKDFKDGMFGIRTVVKVLSLSKKEVSVSGMKKTIYTGVVGDSTAKTHFTAWRDFNLSPGDVIKITDGYIKSWRGIPHLTIDERSTVERYNGTFEALEQCKSVSIAELAGMQGGVDIAVEGITVGISEGSGLVFKCPACNRVVERDVCAIHGDVTGKSIPDLKLRAILDDGTGTMSAFFNRQQVETLLGLKVDECVSLAREKMTPAVITEKIEERLLAKPLFVRGNVTSNAYGLSMFVAQFEFVKKDVKTEATALLHDLTAEAILPEGE